MLEGDKRPYFRVRAAAAIGGAEHHDQNQRTQFLQLNHDNKVMNDDPDDSFFRQPGVKAKAKSACRFIIFFNILNRKN